VVASPPAEGRQKPSPEARLRPSLAADALGWERFALLGHSLGGAVASFVAGVCPGRIERLALIEALGPLSAEADALPGQMRRALAGAARPGRRAPARYPSLEAAVAARRAVGGLSEAAARRLVSRGTRVGDDGIAWRADPRLRLPSPCYFTEAQVLAVLAAIEAPTRLIVAEDGLLAGDEQRLDGRLDALASVTVERLAGGHHLHLERPAAVAASLARFLAPATGPSGGEPAP